MSCKVLVSFGSHQRALTTEGTLPIHYLVKNTFSEEERVLALHVVDLLVDGININHKTTRGETVLHYCLRSKNSLLLEKLLKHGASCNTKNKRGNSAFHTAIIMGRTEAVQLMLEYGADLTLSSQSLTPLELAQNNPSKCKDIIKILLNRLDSVQTCQMDNQLQYSPSMDNSDKSESEYSSSPLP
eukprot:TRINITY_DN1976_c0_g1_i1.p1 TRINITY_DN1976_c0_g1~~TRINITY_DN1976_c0_g1_i1.p1  ORF type:complete len:185 (-),score=26.57 TRINITY_DN1976_c0_g1_i1:24-578(-)